MKCPYCEKEIDKGKYCRTCTERLPLVRQLMFIIEQIKEVKRKRDERKDTKG